ncbi:pre-mRNA splicing factor [Colletotrichum tofieldiae]|nr:pre-mRNA splicing factor [Colletotrichum tofieldiae]
MPPRDFRGARSRSPGGGRRPYPPPVDDYDRRAPPRGYSPRRDGYRDGYRERSPRREYYDDRARYRSPPVVPSTITPLLEAVTMIPTAGITRRRLTRYPRDGYPREYERGGRYW